MADSITEHDTLRVFKIFLASPGDVADERKMVREVVEELNQVVARRLGIRLELYGWEDQRPRTGRAQAVINRAVETCDVFIGMIAERWGSPTGKDTSGFHEEFLIAQARHRDSDGKAPEIMLVFREVDPIRRNDPGEQLTKVLQFRQQVIDERALLFRDYRDTEHLRGQLRLWLEEHLFDAVAPASPTGGQLALSAGPTNTEAVTLTPDDRPPHEQPHLVETLAALQGALSQASFDEYADAALQVPAYRLLRLRLFVTAWLRVVYNGEPMSTHDVNSIYQIRSDIDLVPPEHAFLQETLLGDTADVLPGWYWFQDRTETELLASLGSIATGGRRIELRARAIRFLGNVGTSFSDPEFADLLADAAKDDTGALASALVEHLRETGDRRRLGALTQADAFISNFPKKEQFEALLKVLESDALSTAIDEAIRGYAEFPVQAAAFLERHHTAISEEQLRRMRADPKTQKLIDIATRAQIRRGEFSVDQLREALHAESVRTRAAAVEALIAARGPLTPEEIREALPKPPTSLLSAAALRIGDPEERSISLDDTLLRFFRTRPADELLAKSESFSLDSERAYHALGLDHFDAYGGRIRQDLKERFRRPREQFAQLRPLFRQDSDTSFQRITDFYAQQHAAAALEALAQHGGPADIPFALDHLAETSDIFEPSPAVRLIERFGGAQHVPALIAFAERSYGEASVGAARAATTLAPGPEGAAPALLASAKAELVNVALAALRGSGSEAARKFAEPALVDARDGVRLSAAALLVEELDHAALEEVMARYRGLETYYYDIGCWLDRVLYAPEPLNSLFRRQLRSRLP